MFGLWRDGKSEATNYMSESAAFATLYACNSLSWAYIEDGCLFGVSNIEAGILLQLSNYTVNYTWYTEKIV